MRVVVAGGGIAGLAATFALRTGGAAVTLVESQRRLGGKIETEWIDGFLVERGPDAVLAANPAGRSLLHDLGMTAELIAPEAPGGVYVLHQGRLVPMPEGVGFGIPTRVMPFLRSPLFSHGEKLRAALEIALPAGSGDEDESIGAFLRRRFGDAVVDRLAGPLIGGVYGARVDELSLLALVPRLRDAERKHRSLVLAGLRSLRRTGGSDGMLLAPLRGMGSIVDALVARLNDVDLRLATSVTRIACEGTRYAVSLDGTRIVADAVVVATPSPAAAAMLEELVPAAGAALRAFPYRGTASVSLAYATEQLSAPLAGHGFIAPEGALAMAACTWSSAKWRGRAPAGAVLLRATIRDERVLAEGDRELIATAHGELARVMRISGAPVMAHVARWAAAMPRYTVGHLGRLAAVDASLAAHPRLALAGAAYRGSGVPDCVAQGFAAAARLMEAERLAA